MSIEEITDQMAYDRSISKEFLERQKQKATIAKNAEEEALAVRAMFASMGL